MALVTLQLVKEHLEIPLANTSQDTRLNLLIGVVSEHVEDYCQRTFAETTYSKQYDGTSQSDLVLDEYPVTSVTSLYIDNGRDFDSSALVDADEYELIEPNALRLHHGRFPRGSLNVKVDYVAGYATIPNAIQYATLLIIEQLFRSNEDRRVGRNSVSKNGETVSYIHGWPEEAINLLKSFKRYEFSGGRSVWSN
jgi:hypothetical protein